KRITLVMEQLLPLAYHTQETVVQNHNFHFGTELHNRTQLLNTHLYTAIAYNRNNITMRSTIPCANRCRQSKAHRAQSSGSHIGLRLVELRVATCHHLMLAHIRDNDSITIG